MSVTLSEVIVAARAHSAPLAGESAGYLVLALADQMLSAPRAVTPDDVRLSEDGALQAGRGAAASEDSAERALRGLLDELLLVASSGSAALMRVGRKAPGAGLAALVGELEAALIPVNRAAARRALARLGRETARGVESGAVVLAALEPSEPSDPSITSRVPEVAWDADDELETRALDVVATRAAAALLAAPAPSPVQVSAVEELEIDVELEAWPPEVETKNAPADFVESAPSESIASAAHPSPLLAMRLEANASEEFVERAPEQCTRPEPVMVRAWQRANAGTLEPYPPTPTLGTRIAEVPSRAEAPQPVSTLEAELYDAEPLTEAEVQVFWPPVELPRPSGPKSDVQELLAQFRVSDVEPESDLCRALKGIAGVDLTPAPAELRAAASSTPAQDSGAGLIKLQR